MLQSQLFTKTTKTLPEGEVTKNAQFLIKGGFINKASAGVYSLLPLGLRVLQKINKIIREEMDAIHAEEVLLPALIDKKYWEESGRWSLEVIYRAGKKPEAGVGAHDFEYGLGWTHEEVVTAIAKNFIHSYKDLPKGIYQIQTKFRAEVRPQGGLLRTREFPMKDLYSFHADNEDLNRYYQVVIGAYKKIFKRLKLKTRIVEASGGDFTKEYTHEFQVLNPAGEDTVCYCEKCDFAQNKEVFIGTRHLGCRGVIKVARGIEVGNVFRLGTKFSETFGLRYRDKDGKERPIFMGSYGIGPTRVMGTLVEEYHNERGIIWPEPVAPFQVHLLNLQPPTSLPAGDLSKGDNFQPRAHKIYQSLRKVGCEVLYDDRERVTPGEKFADADLIGIPWRAVVSEKTGAKVEIKKRDQEKTRLVTVNELINFIKE